MFVERSLDERFAYARINDRDLVPIPDSDVREFVVESLLAQPATFVQFNLARRTSTLPESSSTPRHRSRCSETVRQRCTAGVDDCSNAPPAFEAGARALARLPRSIELGASHFQPNSTRAPAQLKRCYAEYLFGCELRRAL